MHVSTSTARDLLVEERRRGIGGTDAAAILGVHPWRTPLQVWAEKTGRAEPEDISGNPRVKAGLKLEAAIADWYAEETGHELAQPGLMVLREAPDSRGEAPLIAHIDRLIVGGGLVEQDDFGILEVKTADKFMSGEWDDGPPVGYQVQWQHYSLVSGYTWGAIVVLIGGNDFRIYPMRRDEEFVGTLRDTLLNWWERHVVADVAPEPTAADTRVLARLFPEDDGETVELPPDAEEWDARLLDVKAQIRELELEKKTLENKLRAAIGPASKGLLPGGAAYTLKTVRRAAYEVPAAEYRVLRRTKR